MTVNPYEAVLAFQSFAGKCMGTLDAIQKLDDEDKAALKRIMHGIAAEAYAMARDHKSEEVRADAAKVAAAFGHSADMFLIL